MTAPEPALDIRDRVAVLCPSFVAAGPPRSFRKSQIAIGTVDGAPVLAKRLAKTDAVWSWYFARELALYRAFAAAPPGVRVPRLVAAADDVVVLERIVGEPLAVKRRPGASLPIRTISALLATTDALARQPSPTTPKPSPRVRAQLRERLLEAPDEPSWVQDGIRLAAKRGLVAEPLARVIDDAFVRYPATAFAHGDLLLRNAIADDDDDVTLVDWECAGVYPRDWDRALLWTQLAPPARGLVEDAVRDSGGRWRAFLGLVIFALARELRFADAFAPTDKSRADRAAIEAELATVAARLD
jgi:aminoglycoside phosphotransferase (APT) family kinase protein